MADGLRSLELRVPPPVVALIAAAAMGGLSAVVTPFALSDAVRIAAAIVIAVIGAGFGIAGNLAFRRVRTTVNPLHPDRATALVRDGVYRVSRNPMYLGLLLLLLGWAVFLSLAAAFLGPLAYMLYLTRFQIMPEERALSAKFGADYAAYCTSVRRWL